MGTLVGSLKLQRGKCNVMEKYLGYTTETIRLMIIDRKDSINMALSEMLQYPSDGHMYKRVQGQLAELKDLTTEWEFRNDDILVQTNSPIE